MSALAVSVLLSFVSALAYAGGAIVQEQVAVSSPDSAYMPLRRPSWWGSLALNGLGGVLHVVALAYGPLSLVQPLGALTIVFALPMAALFVGRKAGATAWRGALMATVGLAVLLSLVGSADAHSLDAAQRVAVALVTGGAVVALMCAGLAAQRHPAVRSVLLATASGIAFGMSSVFTKTVAVDWSQDVGLGDLSALAAIGVFATAGVLLSQASYRGGGLAAPLATLTVVNPVLAAAVGILMFGETFRYGGTGTVLALGCGVVAAGGLIMLTTERMEGTGAAVGTETSARMGTTLATKTSAGTGTTAGLGTAGDIGTSGVPESVSAASESAPARGLLRTVPQQRPAAEPEAKRTSRREPGGADSGSVEPVRRELDGAGGGCTEPVLRESGARVLREPGEGALLDTADPVVLEPDERVLPDSGEGVLLDTADPVLREPGEPVPGGPGEPVGVREADEPGLRELLVPGPGPQGSGGDTEGGEPPARPVPPPPYAELPLSIFVPLPALDRPRTRVRS